MKQYKIEASKIIGKICGEIISDEIIISYAELTDDVQRAVKKLSVGKSIIICGRTITRI